MEEIYLLENQLKTQPQFLLLKLWRGRKHSQGQFHNGHWGWFESYELADSKTGFRCMQYLKDFENRNIPIHKERFKDQYGKLKYYYSLGCLPHFIIWSDIIENWKVWKYDYQEAYDKAFKKQGV